MNQLAEFFVTGGTMLPDAPSYVERKADRELFENLSQGRYCYVLTARQMGKSSLMVRTAVRLREAGVGAVVVDLTSVGRNLSVDQWYVSVLSWIGHGFEEVEDEVEKFWLSQPLVSPVQRWTRALREIVLPRFAGQLVIFVDEVDYVQNLPFPMDEFFAAIRECYNLRAEDERMRRLTFCLIGVATPSNLIRDKRLTPFNIGQRIELNDFTRAEAAPLAAGLRRENGQRGLLLDRVLHWTGGHPYLTQRLCQAIAVDDGVAGEDGVDRLCDKLFLSRRAREVDDNLTLVRDRLLRGEEDRAALLDLYAKTLDGKRVEDDGTHPLVGALRLAGITRAEGDHLKVRNRIYARVFDRNWVKSNMPDAELRRQRAAYRRGLLRAALVGATFLLLVGALAVTAIRERQRAVAEANSLYYAQIRVAQQEFENANVPRVEEILKSLKPQTDLRGFEWSLLWRLIHQEKQALKLKDEVVAVAFSPDAQEIAVAEADRRSEGGTYVYRLSVFDRQWLQETSSFKVGFRNIFNLVRYVSESGQALIEGGDHKARLMDWQSGRARSEFEAHDAALTSLAVSPDGRHVVTADNIGEMRFITVGAGPGIQVKSGGKSGRAGLRVSNVALARDGRRVASIARDEIELWEFATGRLLASFKVDESELALFSPDGRQLFVSTSKGRMLVWDIDARRIIREWDAHTTQIRAAAFSPDGRRLATGSEDRTVKLWDAAGGEALAVIRGHGGGISSIAWSSDNKLIATAGADGLVKVWDVEDAIRAGAVFVGAGVKYLATAFNGKGELFALGVTADERPKLLGARLEREFQAQDGGRRRLLFAAFSPDAKWVAAGGEGRIVTIWDTESGEKRASLAAGLGPENVYAADFSPDGKWLAFIYDDHTLKGWNTKTWQEDFSFEFKQELSYRVVFSPDSKRIAAARADGRVSIRTIGATGEMILEGHTNKVRTIAFSPDGAIVATSGDDNTIRLWDARTGAPLKSPGQIGLVRRIAFSPDGRRLVTGNTEGAVKIWEVTTGYELMSLSRHKAEIRSIAFSKDGTQLAIGGADGVLRRFDLR
ncbi:MAG: AAA-like domain-containing protein [Blastocatellia bacterium]